MVEADRDIPLPGLRRRGSNMVNGRLGARGPVGGPDREPGGLRGSAVGGKKCEIVDLRFIPGKARLKVEVHASEDRNIGRRRGEIGERIR